MHDSASSDIEGSIKSYMAPLDRWDDGWTFFLLI